MSVRIITGDCREVMRGMAPASVHTCVTSPPYFGLRSYGGGDAEIGREETPAAYVAALVEVVTEVWRVLRDDGVVFLNLGDSYFGSSMTGGVGKGTIAGTQQGNRKGSDLRFSRAAYVHSYGSAGITIPDCPCRDCASGNPCDARIDAALSRISRIDGRPAPRPFLESLIRTQARMAALHDRLPSVDYSDQRPTEQSLGAIQGFAQSVLRAVEPLHASLASMQPESWPLPPADSRLLDSVSAFRASLRSCVAYAQACVRILNAASGSPDCTRGNVELCAGLAHHIQCIDGCCSQVLAWLNPPYIQSHCTTLKPKDLIGIPWRVALALQDAGWYLRSDIIWAKKNCMPESVTDRPTRSHEYIFLLAKSERYFYDADAIREPHAGYRKSGPNALRGQQEIRPRGNLQGVTEQSYNDAGRNKRDVWHIATHPFAEAHFATFPEDLIEPCILAGTSEHGCCPQCGAPWRRVVERPQPDMSLRNRGEETKMAFHSRQTGGGQKLQDWYDAHPPRTTGWEPTCTHDREPIPCTVLDPFSGAGTTALVAKKLGRSAVGIELNGEYVAMSERRLASVPYSLFSSEAVAR